MSKRVYMDKEMGKKFLLEISGILDRSYLKFFLMQGTALGAYRDNGFTPTELDIDLGFLAEDFNRQRSVLVNRLMDANYEIETIHRPFKYCRTIVAKKYGVKADLVSFARWKDKRFACSPVDPVNVPRPYAIVHDANMLEDYYTTDLFGRQFRLPTSPDLYLEREYGLDWRTPREDHISRTRVYDYLKELEAEGLDYERFIP